MNCLRCGEPMEDLGCEEIQLGHFGFFSGHLSNLFSGALEVRIYSCPNCGKEVVLGIKFFPNCGANMEVKKTNACPNCGNEVAEGQKFCPNCGTNMDVLNKDKCPNCGALVDKGQKFCPECGSTMSGNKICDNCGAELSSDQKFCGKCGTPVS